MANGAVVSLSTSPNGENVIAKTVADASGVYSFTGVAGGTYHVNATYNPENTNNLTKSAGAVILTGVEVEVSVSGDASADIAMAGTASSGNLNFNADDWSWDNTHSTIEFQFPYDAVNAVFTGHFATVGIDELIINDADLASSSIKAWVDITTVETGSASPPGGHGRDGITGCITGTFKVDKDATDTVSAYSPSGDEITDWPNETLEDYDLWGDGSETSYQKQSAIVGSSGVATFKSTEIVPYGTGYAAKGIFTFAGVSDEVILYFTYLEGFQAENRSGDLTDYVSFYGTFKFAAEADYSVSSGHIGDSEITVKISAQYNAPA
jgi:polyisoprenoid-binding protein YceI